MEILRIKDNIYVQLYRVVDNDKSYFRARAYKILDDDETDLYDCKSRIENFLVAELVKEKTSSKVVKRENLKKTFELIDELFPELSGVRKDTYIEFSESEVEKIFETS